MDEYIFRNKKMLRCGYTTGTCAALAAKGAVTFLATGKWPETAVLMTPGGKQIRAVLEERKAGSQYAECAVRKDGGDDYDVTNGILIFARARFLTEKEPGPQIVIDGGKGVGRVTKPGLNQPVGAAAINSVPRKMIEEAVLCALREGSEAAGGGLGTKRGKEQGKEQETKKRVEIIISVPQGEQAAKKTFNPVLGIEGGISILGTSGIVEPMSEEALTETIRAHMNVLKSEGRKFLAVVPGNIGEGFLRRYVEKREPQKTDADGRFPVVVSSNFIGRTIDMAGELGFLGLVIGGHIGKLVKLGNGIMNTHSREGDGRMDTLISCGLSAGAGLSCLKKIQNSNTTEEALSVFASEGISEAVMEALCERIQVFARRRAREELSVGVILFDASGEVIGQTADAEKILDSVMAEDSQIG